MTSIIAIGRIQGDKEIEYISIGIMTDAIKVEVKLSLEEFALLITGRSLMDCEVKATELRNSPPATESRNE